MSMIQSIRGSLKAATLAHLNNAFTTPIDQLIEEDLERASANPDAFEAYCIDGTDDEASECAMRDYASSVLAFAREVQS